MHLLLLDHQDSFSWNLVDLFEQAGATKVEGDNAILYLWYDNEFGYSNRLVDLVQRV